MNSEQGLVDVGTSLGYRDTSPMRKHPTLYDPPRTLGIGLQ
jgi:hypothetical protein